MAAWLDLADNKLETAFDFPSTKKKCVKWEVARDVPKSSSNNNKRNGILNKINIYTNEKTKNKKKKENKTRP